MGSMSRIGDCFDNVNQHANYQGKGEINNKQPRGKTTGNRKFIWYLIEPRAPQKTTTLISHHIVLVCRIPQFASLWAWL